MLLPRHLWPRRAGFTLIELLVAISILAIIAVLGWRGLDGIVRARTGLSEDMEISRGRQIAFAQLESDCFSLADPEWLRGRNTMELLADGVQMIRFVRAEQHALQFQVVRYRLDAGVLRRFEGLPSRDLTQLDQEWQALRAPGEGAPGVTLLNHIDALHWRIWIDGGPDWRAPNLEEPGNGARYQGTRGGGLTGLEIALSLPNTPYPLRKVMLLGAI